MKRILKWLGIGLAALAVLVGGAAGLGYALLRNTVPATSGALAIAGLSAPVEVVRDKEGVPHIFAKTTDDLYMALGFVHAQDRLWQMELTRRTGQGRLSEVFGERTFTTDVFLRTLDLYGHAERSLAGLPPETRSALEAYARGVNAYIERPDGLAGAAAAARVPAAAPRARAVASGRQRRDRQADGAATLHEPQPRALAPDPGRAGLSRPISRTCCRPTRAARRRRCLTIAELYPLKRAMPLCARRRPRRVAS